MNLSNSIFWGLELSSLISLLCYIIYYVFLNLLGVLIGDELQPYLNVFDGLREVDIHGADDVLSCRGLGVSQLDMHYKVNIVIKM
jgi:hypothetical protein